eukprot:6520906-Prymnesium_polylepis.1
MPWRRARRRRAALGQRTRDALAVEAAERARAPATGRASVCVCVAGLRGGGRVSQQCFYVTCPPSHPSAIAIHDMACHASIAINPSHGVESQDAVVSQTQTSVCELPATPKALGSLESEKAKVQRLLAHAQELEAMVEAPFDPAAAGLLVPDVVERPDKAGPAGRKRLTAMHGSVTMHAGGWGGG